MPYFIIESQSTNLVKYHLPIDINQFKSMHVAFSGCLGKHPYDAKKIVLISDPYAKNISYYEFDCDDIGLVEKLPNLINNDGEDVAMSLLWVKKDRIAIRSSVFIVAAEVNQ